MRLATLVTAAVGEVALLPLVVLVSFMPQPELLAAMSEDNLIPSIFHEVDKVSISDSRSDEPREGTVLVDRRASRILSLLHLRCQCL